MVVGLQDSWWCLLVSLIIFLVNCRVCFFRVLVADSYQSSSNLGSLLIMNVIPEGRPPLAEVLEKRRQRKVGHHLVN
jgi:hypothetical protein